MGAGSHSWFAPRISGTIRGPALWWCRTRRQKDLGTGLLAAIRKQAGLQELVMRYPIAIEIGTDTGCPNDRLFGDAPSSCRRRPVSTTSVCRSKESRGYPAFAGMTTCAAPVGQSFGYPVLY